jgi:hypothetical protein
MLPVDVNVPVAESYSSALAIVGSFAQQTPPATRTFPLGSSVAVWRLRAVIILPVIEKLPRV